MFIILAVWFVLFLICWLSVDDKFTLESLKLSLFAATFVPFFFGAIVMVIFNPILSGLFLIGVAMYSAIEKKADC